jgi:hypothetical protein
VFGGFVFVVVFLAMPWCPVSGCGFFWMPVFGVFLLGQIFSDLNSAHAVFGVGVFVWRV